MEMIEVKKVRKAMKSGDLEDLLDNEYVHITLCGNCTECVEHGGHANCGGYLFCRRERKLVTETDGCSWGIERC